MSDYEKDLDQLHGFDLATGRIRSMKESTPNYRRQPYMPHLVTIQSVMIDHGVQSVSFVEHKDSCGGRRVGWHKGICDCQPDVILHFKNEQTYRYRTTEPEAERFLRSWLEQNKRWLG